jgi:hypothetical protein
MSSGRVAALATRNHEFYDDRVFDPIAVQAMRPSLQPMALPWLHAFALARTRGLRLLTADRVAVEGVKASQVQLIAYDWTPDAQALLQQGATPSVLVSFEPPVIAWQLYADLRRLSQRFRHVCLFEGARDRVSKPAVFHPLAFPQACRPPIASNLPWGERRLLCMINSNKALPRIVSPARWLDRPREVSLRRALAAMRYRPIAHDRYRERLRAIDAFANTSDFDLYGEGWRRRHPAIGKRQHARALRAYRGTVDDKLATLTRYKFTLAIENTRFRGYISEKLFDCFLAGTIPVYDGAPDVSSYVPSGAFVDARAFRGYRELERFLRSVSASTATRYTEAAKEFLASPAGQRFCADTFARELVDALLDDGQE